MGAGGSYKYGQVTMCVTEGSEQETTEAAVEMATAAGGRRRKTEDPPVRRKDKRAGGKYRVVSIGTEESAEKISECSGEEMEESASE